MFDAADYTLTTRTDFYIALHLTRGTLGRHASSAFSGHHRPGRVA
jgi:hypothetical protein